MSLAETTRAAIRDRPFLYDALRAGVVNHTAAARALDVGDDIDAVAAAIRRYRDHLADIDRVSRDARVTMERGLRMAPDDPVVRIGPAGFSPGGGDTTGITVTGPVDALVLEHLLGLLRTNETPVTAAAAIDDFLFIAVPDANGAGALRTIEAGLDGSPPPDNES